MARRRAASPHEPTPFLGGPQSPKREDEYSICLETARRGPHLLAHGDVRHEADERGRRRLETRLDHRPVLNHDLEPGRSPWRLDRCLTRVRKMHGQRRLGRLSLVAVRCNDDQIEAGGDLRQADLEPGDGVAAFADGGRKPERLIPAIADARVGGQIRVLERIRAGSRGFGGRGFHQLCTVPSSLRAVGKYAGS